MDDFISAIIKNSPIEDQPYFRSLLNQTMDKEQFIKSQVSILDAVEFFSRPMLMISSRLNTYEDRMVIIRNILDEHGNGELAKNHGKTYRQYLRGLGVSEKKLNLRKKHKEVIKFNKTIMECARRASTLTSIAMMGIIEHRYSTISSIIVQAILDREWIEKDTLSHYSTHEDLDVEHSKDFYGIISFRWKNIEAKEKIKKGLLLGNATIINLYNKLM